MKKRTRQVLRAAVSAVLIALSFPFGHIVQAVLCTIALAVSGYDVVAKAASGVCRGRLLDESFLMTVASVGALCLQDFREAAAIMLFYRVGNIFEDFAVSSSRKAVQELVSLCPDTARVIQDGVLTSVDPGEVEIGQTVVVLPGDRIPIDGIVTDGQSALDTSSLTGESRPYDISVGDEVLSGAVNLSARLCVKTTRPFEQSASSRILRTVEEAVTNKAKTESFITRFAKVYTPIVVVVAVLLAVVPPLVGLGRFSEWLNRALMCLVVSCPCALVISVPLTFFCGIGKASSSGILVKGSDALEMTAKVDTVLFDKTGTLTKGNFDVVGVYPQGSGEALLRAAAYAEAQSTHPIAVSLKRAYHGTVDETKITSCEAVAGKGVRAIVDDSVILVGNGAFMTENNVPFRPTDGQTVVYVAKDGVFLGAIEIDDEVKPNAALAVSSLRKENIKDIRMLSGDRDAHARRVAEAVGLDGYQAELLPEDKVQAAEEIGKHHTVLYVGDGINDAPVLIGADVGVAMGGIGSDVAMDSADVIVTDDNIDKIAYFIRLCKKTMRIAKENIAFSLLVKVGIVVLGALGVVNMWVAVFGDVGVLILAIANAMRIMGIRKYKETK